MEEDDGGDWNNGRLYRNIKLVLLLGVHICSNEFDEKAQRAHMFLEDVKFGDLEAEVIEINANSEKLQRGYNELVEYKLVLQKVGEYFRAAHNSAIAQHRESDSASEESLETPLLTNQDPKTDQGKGNVFLRQAPVDEAVVDPSSGKKVYDTPLYKLYRAKSKVLKICEAFGENRYPFADDPSQQEQTITEVCNNNRVVKFVARRSTYLFHVVAKETWLTDLKWWNIHTIPNQISMTRINLDFKGIDLNSVRGPVCDDALETEERHLAISLARKAKLKAPLLNLFDAVVQTTLWLLWRYRNEFTFALKRPRTDLLFKMLISILLIGLKLDIRFSVNWIEWFDNPCNTRSIPL
ncbi:V-type proton ATPase subunit A3 [Tanacetum coccineum]